MLHSYKKQVSSPVSHYEPFSFCSLVGGEGVVMKTYAILSTTDLTFLHNAGKEHAAFLPVRLRFTRVILATNHDPCVAMPLRFCH